MEKLSLQDMSVEGKRVLVRVDFNVPLNKDGSILDDTRIRESLPSIEYILTRGGSIILMSHLGRPKGKKDPQFSLAVCAKRLSELLNKPVLFSPDCVGPETQKMAESLKSGQVLLIENLRFYAAEEDPASDPSFIAKLASLGDLYINDAFGTAHRAHASTALIASYFPKKAGAGFLMQKEIAFLGTLLTNPKKPFYAIIGGAKISSKIKVLQSLLTKVDAIFIGGGMAYTFFKAQGISIGDSICEDDLIKTAKEFLNRCVSQSIPLFLPKDLLIASAFQDKAPSQIISTEAGIPAGWQGMDIGPQTLKEWLTQLRNAATIFWNGPVGVFEFSSFAKGTQGLALGLSELPATTVVGGGDSVAAINALNISNKFSHISTGGGASLEYIELGHLPGIDALSNKN